jgi:hypothetical protein
MPAFAWFLANGSLNHPSGPFSFLPPRRLPCRKQRLAKPALSTRQQHRAPSPDQCRRVNKRPGFKALIWQSNRYGELYDPTWTNCAMRPSPSQPLPPFLARFIRFGCVSSVGLPSHAHFTLVLIVCAESAELWAADERLGPSCEFISGQSGFHCTLVARLTASQPYASASLGRRKALSRSHGDMASPARSSNAPRSAQTSSTSMRTYTSPRRPRPAFYGHANSCSICPGFTALHAFWRPIRCWSARTITRCTSCCGRGMHPSEL